MKTKKVFKSQNIFKKFQSWVWPNKLHFLIALTALLLVCGLVFALFAMENDKNQPAPTETTAGETQEETVPASEDSEQANNDDSQTGGGSTQAPVAFAISKVFFREYPTTPPGAEEGSCSEGQEVSFPVAAEVTHVGSGTATYHWEVNPRDGSVQKTGEESITFTSSGTTRVTKTLSFKVTDTSSLTGLPAPAFQNRLHMNLVFSSPNVMYANMDNPYFGSGNFVWGNYLDICD